MEIESGEQMLKRSYALKPCPDCEGWGQTAPESDYGCPRCETSPKERVEARRRAPKILVGNDVVELQTTTEVMLAAALKAVLCERGDPGTVKGVSTEFYLQRFSFKDSHDHRRGTVQIGQDGNNGRDLVRLR